MTLPHSKPFITAIRPFDRLRETELEQMAAALDIHYFPQGQTVQKAGETGDYLFILFKGEVRQEDSEGGVTLLGPREFFDSESLLTGPGHHDFIAVEDTLAFALPRQQFLDLARGNGSFQDYFFQNLSQKIAELQEINGSGDLNPLVTGRVKDVDIRPLLVVDAADRVQQAAFLMREFQVDAVLVYFSNGELGLVTSTFIRDAVAAPGFDANQPVAQFARHGVVTIANDELLFNAVLLMTRHQLSRLLVEKQGEPIGFLELVDLLSYLSNHSHLVVNRIERATTLALLREAADKLPMTVRTLYVKGVKVRYVARLMREMNRRLMNKLYTLLAPPAMIQQSALVVMGSEGRGEQLLKSDQDNALLLRDGVVFPDLAAFRQELHEALKTLGFPACPGGIMFTDPEWCAPLGQFQERIRGWIDRGEAADLMQLAIFYDATAVAGNAQLLQQARQFLLDHLPDNHAFFARFAQPTISFTTPLGSFSQFIVEKQGERQELDIKKGGIFPIVHGIRSLALENRLQEVNTAKRIRALTRRGLFDTGFANDLVEAFDFMSGIRLQFMLEQGTLANPHPNRVDPARLTTWQKELLKDSFRAVNRLKKLVVHHYRLDLLG